jgi:hypothetical protein
MKDLKTMEELIITKVRLYFTELNSKVSSKLKELLKENN